MKNCIAVLTNMLLATGPSWGKELGFGAHGIVFAAKHQTDAEASGLSSAVKVHERAVGYCRERDVYLRLQG